MTDLDPDVLEARQETQRWVNKILDALAKRAVDNAIERAGTTRAGFLEDFPAQAPAWIDRWTETVRIALDSAMWEEVASPDLAAMAAEERWMARDMEIDRAAERWKEGN